MKKLNVPMARKIDVTAQDVAWEVLEIGLKKAGFFVYETDCGWGGGISLNHVSVINWQRRGVNKFTVNFYYKDSSQPIEVILGLENFEALSRCFLNQ